MKRVRTLAAAISIAMAMATGSAVAASPSETPSQAEIERLLKTRGLPSLGTAPASQSGAGLSVPANAPAGPARTDRTATPRITLNTITFAFGSAELTPESTETLRNLGNALNQGLKEERAFSIEGHTDRVGSRSYNDELSRRRAQAVKDYLVNELGVSRDRLQTIGKGYSDPANPTNPYAGENRRVVIVNLGA